MLKRLIYGFLFAGFLLIYLILPFQVQAEAAIGCCIQSLGSANPQCTLETESACYANKDYPEWLPYINTIGSCSASCSNGSDATTGDFVNLE